MTKTIMATGGTGYVGSWVVKELLEKGYTVRLTVRNKNKTSGYDHLTAIAEKSPGKLEVWEADLLKEGSFDEAASGADAIIHMASPFTLAFKDPQKELIDPALLGTRNVLNAANKSQTVKKIVLTSSVAAVHGDNIDMQELGVDQFTEEHFNYSSSVSHQPYSYSKVVAEKEAWKMHDEQDKWKLVVINPSLVLGPSLTKTSASESLTFMDNFISGKLFMGAPDLQFGFVDVRDVAKAHLLALENDETKGRHILAERTAGVNDISNIIKERFGNRYKLPIMVTPKPMVYLMGWMFGLKHNFIKRNIGYNLKLDNSKSKKVLGLKYRPLEDTVEDMIRQMEEQ